MHPIYIMFYLGLHNYVLFLQILLHVLISTMVIYILQRQGLIRPIMLPSHCKTTLKTSYMCVIKAALMEYYQSILLYMLRLNLLLMYDTIQVQRGKCVLFSIVYYTVLYSPLHPNKVVNNVTIEINNKSMATHKYLRFLYNNLRFS